MSIATTCPSCEAFFRLADTLAGKRVQCQKCMTRFIVPGAGSDETQPGLPVESVSASTPKSAPPKPASKPAPIDQDESEEEERPRRKKRDEPADDEDDRPRKKRRVDIDDEDDDDRPRRNRRDDDDDEDDDRPRKRKKKARKSGGSSKTMIFVFIGIAAVLLFCVSFGVGGWLLMRNVDGGGPTTVVFGPDNTFRSDSTLRIWDPTKNGRHFRLYTVPMEVGKTYEIDMSSRVLDSYLVLLDENNQVLFEHDDVAPGNLNARIIFRPQRPGNYKIEASTFSDQETGTFSLTIRRR